MTQIKFSYRRKENPQNTWNFYTPSFDFDKMYPEMKGVVTMTDEILSFDKYKVLPNWQKSWVNIWIVEVDEATLAMFGKDLAYVNSELLIVWATYAMKIEINASLAEFLRTYTDYTESSPNVFILSEWGVSPMGETIEPRILDLN